VFQLLHDYHRRAEWDTLLRDARLCPGWSRAQLHATSVCTGRWFLGGIALKTEYVSFKPPAVAAVKMLNRPVFFEAFAATIRHRDTVGGGSSVEYIYHFTHVRGGCAGLSSGDGRRLPLGNSQTAPEPATLLRPASASRRWR
jgi:hypothetical protein